MTTERADFSNADLRGYDLSGHRFEDCNFTNANLSGASLDGAMFIDCDMRGVNLDHVTAEDAVFERTNLQHAHLHHVSFARSHYFGGSLQNSNLYRADFRDVELRGVQAGWMHATMSRFESARVTDTHFNEAQFRGVRLAGATFQGGTFTASLFHGIEMQQSTWRDVDLSKAMLFEVECDGAVFENCTIFAIGVCRVKGTPRLQSELNTGAPHEPKLLVDDFKLGPFLYEIDRDEAIPRLFELLASKLVLILGRFLPQTKRGLDRLHAELRLRNYVPVLVDSELDGRFNATTLVSVVAMCTRFVVVDVTNPKTVIAEVDAILKQRPVPVQPIVLAGQPEPVQFPMARGEGHRQLLALFEYKDVEDLVDNLDRAVIGPCEEFLMHGGQ